MKSRVQMRKERFLAEIKAILPKGWKVSISYPYGRYVAKVTVPYAVADLLQVGKRIAYKGWEYKVNAGSQIEVNQYRIKEQFNNSEKGLELAKVSQAITDIFNSEMVAVWNESDQVYDRDFYYSIVLVPSKVAVEESNLDKIVYSAVEIEEGYYVNAVNFTFK